MSLYYAPWIMLIIIGLWTSVAVFLWAVRHGQFVDQERARYLPLRGEQAPASGRKGRGSLQEICVLLGILLIGVMSILAVVATIILKGTGGRV